MERRSRADLGSLLAILLVIAALYLGRPLLMPLALALLITFLLAPLVDRLERVGLGRTLSVVVLLLMLGAAAGGIGWMVAREASALADELPQYRTNLRAKIRDLRGPIGSLSGAAEEINKLGDAVEKQQGRPAPKVEVVESPHMLGKLGDLLALLASPVGTAGLVAVLALFMLLDHEELRDRMIWLTGAQDLTLTTHAVDDATQRVSRYLGMQSLICGIQGLGVGIGLAVIGVPGAVLWGALSAVLRFLPYFGPWLAAAGPIALSLAAFSGWSEPLFTVALFVSLELITNNVLEPWLYGASVGLSPFGVVFSAVFWAWLWGIPGLLLATPLTVCLVVAGRYVRALEYFPVLLGDRPALQPEVRLYQRLLALDVEEGAAVLAKAAAEGSLEAVSDGVVLPVLRRLAGDDERDLVPDSVSAGVRERLEELLDDLLEKGEASVPAEGPRALFVPALDESDALAARWLAKLATTHGLRCEVASPHELVSELAARIAQERPDVVCISTLGARSFAHARHLCKRLAAAGNDRELVVGLWAAPPHEFGEWSQAAGARTHWIATAAELQTALESVRARWSRADADLKRT
jgi:predicted PurR-regulated permease PerM/methylmalonyl-CoA mutase cobalamin-binding subunit